MKNSPLYIGLMSGTSVDAIDAVIAQIDDKCSLIASHSHPIPAKLKTEIRNLFLPGDNEIERMGRLDSELALLYGDAVDQLLKQADLNASDIRAIGCHGQTIRHRPPAFTLQIGDANRLAAITGIDVVADFRRRDMALGGEGAPLAPAFHHAFLSGGEPRAILNLGGIANLTYLVPEKDVIGFDVGPANALLDAWAQRHTQREYDDKGSWAEQGEVSDDLLSACLAEPYLGQAAPKSSGKELFNIEWLAEKLSTLSKPIEPVDVQATLNIFTVETIAQALEQEQHAFAVYACGGGIHNSHLINCLSERLGAQVQSTSALGLDPDWLEALCFAWLAERFIEGKPGNIPSVTGARDSAVLGSLHPA
jgi:anhydro-N-acetylmuramic acid kinase